MYFGASGASATEAADPAATGDMGAVQGGLAPDMPSRTLPD